jgi:hypothetical protein
MLDFPKWFEKALQVLECPKCNDNIKKEYILAEGIRKSIVHENDTAFFIEYKCPKCLSHATIELTKMSVEEFVLEMVDLFASQDDGEGEKSATEEDFENFDSAEGDSSKKTKNTSKNFRKKTKITPSEFDGALKMIKSCKTHEEFLLNIGVSQEEIDELGKKGEK